MEPLIVDTLNKGHCIKYLFIKENVSFPKFTRLYNPLIVDNLSIMDNILWIYIVPKVSVIRRFHCIYRDKCSDIIIACKWQDAHRVIYNIQWAIQAKSFTFQVDFLGQSDPSHKTAFVTISNEGDKQWISLTGSLATNESKFSKNSDGRTQTKIIF